jgi:hypothetical protein
MLVKTDPKLRPAMGQIIKKIWNLMHPSISRQKALKIAQKQCMPPLDAFEIYDSEPSNWSVYCNRKDEEYWYVQRSIGDSCSLCSSHAIVISKKTGDVVYDGAAHDEG